MKAIDLDKKPSSLLNLCNVICILLVISIYLLYRAPAWPLGIEAFECFAADFALLFFAFLLWQLKKRGAFAAFEELAIKDGLYIGILWTIEISMNNVIHPGLPLRDILDDVFWAIIAFLILIRAIVNAYKSKSILIGIKSGLYSSTASGAVACFTALILIVAGMPLILNDPLNILEWAGQKHTAGLSMAVYFAYQTLAGAIMHLLILGGLMGLLLGVIGGFIGKLLLIFGQQ